MIIANGVVNSNCRCVLLDTFDFADVTPRTGGRPRRPRPVSVEPAVAAPTVPLPPPQPIQYAGGTLAASAAELSAMTPQERLTHVIRQDAAVEQRRLKFLDATADLPGTQAVATVAAQLETAEAAYIEVEKQLMVARQSGLSAASQSVEARRQEAWQRYQESTRR